MAERTLNHPQPLKETDVEKRPIPNELSISVYMHCSKCIDEWKVGVSGTEGQSPATYSQLSVGWTPQGLQVWCRRHDCNVLHVDFEGTKHPANVKA